MAARAKPFARGASHVAPRAIEKNQRVVDTEHFQTSTPGVYAVGDVNTCPGKRKSILCGFHEATLAAFSIKARLNPGKKESARWIVCE